MTSTVQTLATTAAEAVALEFFAAYDNHNTTAMVMLCTENADFHYKAFEMWGKQRVMRGDGKVHTIGRPLWDGSIRAFPNLSVTVRRISSSNDGYVVAEVDEAGTQAAPWGVIGASGGQTDLNHLFILHVNDDGRIDEVTCYWDNARLFRQLGHQEVD